LIAFWNGKSTEEDDRDTRLVKYMVDLMRDTGGIIEQINPEKLLNLRGRSTKKTTPKSTKGKAPAKKSA
jgi:hypothetical protein